MERWRARLAAQVPHQFDFAVSLVRPFGCFRIRAVGGVTSCVVGVIALLGLAWGASPGTAWLTGQALEQQLGAAIPRVFWSGAPLRQVIRTISTSQRVAVLLDRRVDPDQTVELALNDVTVDELLRRIAEDRGLGVTRVGPVTYVGPQVAASRLRTLALLRREDVAKLSTHAAGPLLRTDPIAWDDFATPRGLLEQLAAPGGIAVQGLERVPHDLWAAADLPPLPLVDRLTLIAVQLDLTFRIAADGRSLVLVPVPDEVAVVRRYRGGSSPQRLAEQWSARVPGCEVKVVGDEIYVRGLVEEHEQLSLVPQPAGRPKARRPASAGRHEVRYTVNSTRGPLDRLLNELSQKLQIVVKIDREALERAGISPSQVVPLSVQDATLDELLEELLSQAGCTFRREGNVVTVLPAK